MDELHKYQIAAGSPPILQTSDAGRSSSHVLLTRPEVSLQLGDVVLGAAHGVTVAPSHDAESLISSRICMPHGRSRGYMYMHCLDRMKRSVPAAYALRTYRLSPHSAELGAVDPRWSASGHHAGRVAT